MAPCNYRGFCERFRCHVGAKVYYDAARQEQEQPADLILLCAFTLSNIRLLLLSNISTPYDPQANTGVVGRNFT